VSDAGDLLLLAIILALKLVDTLGVVERERPQRSLAE